MTRFSLICRFVRDRDDRKSVHLFRLRSSGAGASLRGAIPDPPHGGMRNSRRHETRRGHPCHRPILHDTVEDTLATLEQIEEAFGKDVAFLVDGLTKISKISLGNQEERQAENFRKMILAMSSDIRILLVRLADRVHNMRTLEYQTPDTADLHRQGDPRTLCAAGKPTRHQLDEDGAGGPLFPLSRF